MARRPGPNTNVPSGTVATDPESKSVTEPLDQAPARLEAEDPDRVIETAYAIARGRMAETISADGAKTHWEFFTACSDNGMGMDRLDALETLTEAYERAVFAPRSVRIETAEGALAAARGLTTDSVT